MEHTILVHGTQSAVIVAVTPTQYTVTAYVSEVPTVAYDTATMDDATRWAKAVIAYPGTL
jgi:hypothetical protein